MALRIAVVTPYYRESPEVLARCIESVQSQQAGADHILVADGFPQQWVERYENVCHVAIGRNSADFGDTPRSVGLAYGVRGDYDVLQLLDADNVLLPGHFASVLDCLGQSAVDIVVAQRELLRRDGSVLEVDMVEDLELRHVDTSCFVFARRAFSLALKWAFIPKPLGFADDRVFYAAMHSANLRVAMLAQRTVGYTCMWPGAYTVLGEQPPAGHRDLAPHLERAQAWLRSLPAERRNQIAADLGVSFEALEDFSWLRDSRVQARRK